MTAPIRSSISASQLTKLANENESLTIRNTKNTIVIFTNNIANSNDVQEFAANGDPDGRDVAEVSSVWLRNPTFRRAMLQGIFEVLDAESDEAIEAIESWKTAAINQELIKQQASDSVQTVTPVAFNALQCIAPDGLHRCAEYAVTKTTDSVITSEPPLCRKHKNLAKNYLAEETNTFKDGKPELRWNVVTLTK